MLTIYKNLWGNISSSKKCYCHRPVWFSVYWYRMRTETNNNTWLAFLKSQRRYSVHTLCQYAAVFSSSRTVFHLFVDPCGGVSCSSVLGWTTVQTKYFQEHIITNTEEHRHTHLPYHGCRSRHGGLQDITLSVSRSVCSTDRYHTSSSVCIVATTSQGVVKII